MARNITLTLEASLIERARQYARARDLTLNSLIRQLLKDAVDPRENTGPELTFRLIDEAEPKSSKGQWRREDLYDRKVR